MWYKNENGSLTKPEALDKTSSKTYVYVRKEFAEISEQTIGDQTIPAHYEWMEMKILKSDWDVYEKVLGHDTALDDVYAALTELAEMIIEG